MSARAMIARHLKSTLVALNPSASATVGTTA